MCSVVKGPGGKQSIIARCVIELLWKHFTGTVWDAGFPGPLHLPIALGEPTVDFNQLQACCSPSSIQSLLVKTANVVPFRVKHDVPAATRAVKTAEILSGPACMKPIASTRLQIAIANTGVNTDDELLGWPGLTLRVYADDLNSECAPEPCHSGKLRKALWRF